MSRICWKKVWTVLCQNVKRIMWFPIKLRYRQTAKFKIGRHQIERTSQSAAFAIMNFCAFSMQINNYTACATILRNEISENDQDLLMNPTEATIVLCGYCSGSTDLWRVNCQFDDLKYPFLCSLYATSSKRNCHLFLVEIGNFMFFLSIICQITGLLLNKDIFVVNILLARTFTVFT